MLYAFLDLLEQWYQPPGFGAFAYISVRAAFAALFALIISIIFGKRIINWLASMQLKETIREDVGLDHHKAKAGTPSMGGIIILLATLIPTILWVRLDNIYALLIIFVMLALGVVGFVDDYIKIIKKDKRGLLGRFKLAGQVTVGLILGLVLYFTPEFEPYRTLSTLRFVKDINID